MKYLILFIISSVFFFSCNDQAGKIDGSAIKKDIIKVMRLSEKDWNEGDLEGYMMSYHRSDSIRFAGGGKVTYGWETVLEKYRSGYPDKSAMGILTFSEMDITVISDETATVFGRWKLIREKDKPHGLFTLLFRKYGEDWRIVHDHTSSGD